MPRGVRRLRRKQFVAVILRASERASECARSYRAGGGAPTWVGLRDDLIKMKTRPASRAADRRRPLHACFLARRRSTHQHGLSERPVGRPADGQGARASASQSETLLGNLRSHLMTFGRRQAGSSLAERRAPKRKRPAGGRAEWVEEDANGLDKSMARDKWPLAASGQNVGRVAPA